MTSQARTSNSQRSSVLIVSGIVIAVSVLLALAVAVFNQRVFMPKERVEIADAFQGYEPQAMGSCMDVQMVQSQFDTILSFGDRFLGNQGMYKTERYIRDFMKSRGYEIYEQTVKTASPRTRLREIRIIGSGGQPDSVPAGVELFPFMPNHMQPVATPSEGIRGRLVLLNNESISAGHDFRGCIGVVDSDEGRVDGRYGFSWVKYARLGISGLIITCSSGLDNAPWFRIGDRFDGMVSSIPINFVRLAATQQILEYVGKDVVLRVESRYENVPNTTIMAVLRAPQLAREAIVINGSYDACSLLPDRAPAGFQTVNLAAQLQLASGVAAYRESLRRDVIFLFTSGSMMAEDGLNNFIRLLRENKGYASKKRFLQAFGVQGKEQGVGAKRLNPLEMRLASNHKKLNLVESLLTLFDNPQFCNSSDETENVLDSVSEDARKFFDEQVAYALNTVAFELSEPLVQSKLAFVREGGDVKSGEFQQYLAAKSRFGKASSSAGYKIQNLLRKKSGFVKEYRVRDLVRKRIQELCEYHRDVEKQTAQEVEIVKQINQYSEITAFQVRLATAFNDAEKPEILTFAIPSEYLKDQAHRYMNLLSVAQSRLDLTDSLNVVPYDSKSHFNKVVAGSGWVPNYSSKYWGRYGYPAYAFVNLGRRETCNRFAVPVLKPYHRDIASLRHSFEVMGETILSVAHGNARFSPGTYQEWVDYSFAGQVLVGNIGQSIVPSYPLKGALVACRGFEQKAMFNFPGYFERQILITDPYGKYRLEKTAADWWDAWRSFSYGEAHNPMAAKVGDDGIIRYMKDEGEDGQRLFKSVNLNLKSSEIGNVTIVVFRASPVSIIDLTNPQNMKDYAGVDMLSTGGLTEFKRECRWEAIGINMTYLEPAEHFYVALKSGAIGNELVQVTRGFMLGIDSTLQYNSEKEIDGPGYLVADNAILVNVARETAKSMAYVNGKRLELQNKYHMADDRTNAYHAKTLAFIDSSQQADKTFLAATRAARDAVIYASLNHPVLRESVMEAVLGIIWYLALLVPFVFFFEKLVFCFSDVRKQLAAEAAIFITAFLLLRVLHPAFQMVRSSIMILLGFIIIIISTGLTILFASKFKENLEDIRSKQGKVSAAEINTMGVMVSAFMLGLNNMHRRKMRTGLTCATLTLLTFVMICFTSVENNIVDENTAVAKAPYQGMLVRRERFEPLSSAEVFAFQSRFGDKYKVCERRVLIGRFRDGKYRNPELKAVRDDGSGLVRRADFESVLQMQHDEPLRSSIQFLTHRGWFADEDDVDNATELPPVFIPDKMAGQLGIEPEQVDSGDVPVMINGRRFLVRGIFLASSLDNLKDLDGMDLLPMDLEAMPTVVESKVNVLQADDDDPRISADNVVIMPMQNLFDRSSVDFFNISLSVSVNMAGAGYRQAKTDIETYMEQTAQPVYYGLDGVAYKGKRVRGTTMAGLIDLIIPLIIAGLTVLNTMKGSVYERRGEIFVYNAVGIAPRYVFFMFIAEAFVYAVVGSILGYLISQGTGKILTVFNLTGGLNMTFTSITTIYASLTVAAAVFLSTFSPAKSAMEISAPAEDSGWSLPEPLDDELAFDLPFNFGTTGRVAVLVFFERYLMDHGEGSSGRFYAGDPAIEILSEMDETLELALVPQIGCTIWLKPFDLAVSQTMVITMPPDPDTGLYKARISLMRESGTRESWMRLNKGFVAQVRKHFLHWRAVSEEERQEMFVEAKKKMEILYAGADVSAQSV